MMPLMASTPFTTNEENYPFFQYKGMSTGLLTGLFLVAIQSEMFLKGVAVKHLNTKRTGDKTINILFIADQCAQGFTLWSTLTLTILSEISGVSILDLIRLILTGMIFALLIISLILQTMRQMLEWRMLLLH